MTNPSLRRLLSLILCMILCLSILPASAFAEGEFPEEQAEEALPPIEEAVIPEEPAEEPAPVEIPEEEPAEEPAEAPAEEVLPAEEPAEAPAEDALSAEEPAEEPESESVPFLEIPEEEIYGGQTGENVKDEAAFANWDPADGHSQTVTGTLTLGNSVSGSTSSANLYAYYRFVAPAAGLYRFFVSSNSDAIAILYSSSWSVLTSDDDSGGGSDPLLSYSLSSGQTVYLCVGFYDESPDSFSASVTQGKAGWSQIDGLWYYYYEDGSTPVGVCKIGSVKYGFDSDGRMLTDQAVWNGENDDYNYYFVNSKGIVQESAGWKKTADGRYYYAKDSSGHLLCEEWNKCGSSSWYYFWDNCMMADDGGYVLFDGNGTSAIYFFKAGGAWDNSTGWKKTSYGEYWYISSTSGGHCVTGWQTIGGKQYYFDPYEGRMYRGGTYSVGGVRVFFANDGSRGTPGWNKTVRTGKWTDSQGVTHTQTYTDWYYLDADSNLVTGWKKISGSWYYFDSHSGRMYKDGSYMVDGKYYFFGESGAMGTGWCRQITKYTDSDGKEQTRTTWYYADSSGVLRSGWQTIGGKRYYFDVTGWMYANDLYEIDGKRYIFGEDGALIISGWFKRSGTYTDENGKQQIWADWYYTDASGSPVTGWKKIGGSWYYFQPEWGYMYKNAVTDIDGKRYCFSASGALITSGWYKTTNTYTTSGGSTRATTSWYYCDANGVVQTGWQTIGSSRYCFYAWGAMMQGGIFYVDGVYYFFQESGAVAGAGWQSIQEEYNGGTRTQWYYTNADGSLVTGWKKIGGSWYYFNRHMYADGLYWLEGKYEYFQPNGAWVATGSNTAWRRVDGGMRYYENGKMVTGWKKIGGKYFYFEANGNMKTGWVKSGSTWYYCSPAMASDSVWFVDGKYYFFAENGAMISKPGWYKREFTNDGSKYVEWYYVNSGGALSQGWQTIGGKQYYFDPVMLADGFYQIDGVMYEFDKNGAYTGEHYTPGSGQG